MPVNLITFDEAISQAQQYSRRHLLIGNGFSIACIPTIFTYQSIFNEANFDEIPEAQEVFRLLETMDFEHVINSLDVSSKVIQAYDEQPETSQKMADHAERIKNILITTIASNHPANPSEIPDEQFSSCRKFLSHFIGDEEKGRIYSTNYDLLLYWTLMHAPEGEDDEDFKLEHNDGFSKEVDEHFRVQSDDLIWQGKQEGQRIFYIHGALHLYQGRGEIEKFCWSTTGIPLIDQAREALSNNKYPLFVSEGDHSKKFSRIMHNPYLYNCFENFKAIANGGRGKRVGHTCLFIHGLSFSDNDTHITDCISHGKIKHIYVGLFGDPESDSNRSIIARCESMKQSRNDHPLEVSYYDSESASIWNG